MSHDILKALFSSQTRVKLLSVFLLHPDDEYFIRQLTRLLSEQINSIRRELENLRRIGLVKARHKNRRKFYKVDTAFPLYQELKSMFSKGIEGGESPTVKSLKNLSGVEFLLLAGAFANTESKIDLLIVGSVRKDSVEMILNHDAATKNARYSLFSKADFLYRLSLKDRFIVEVVDDPRHVIALNTIEREMDEARK